MPLDRNYLPELGYPIPIALYLATHHLRLALRVVARMPINSLSVMAPDCSSWGIPARGSSKRNFINSTGQLFSAWYHGILVLNSFSVYYTIWIQMVRTRKEHGVIRSRFGHGTPDDPRMVCLILVVLSHNSVFVVEQPANSLLIRHYRMDWLVNHVCIAPCQEFNMVYRTARLGIPTSYHPDFLDES